MQIRMLITKIGSPDGIQINTYEAGRKYDLPESLAGNFLGQGAAEEDKELVLETKTLEVKDEAEADSGAAGGAGKPRRGKKLPKG